MAFQVQVIVDALASELGRHIASPCQPPTSSIP